VTNLQTVLKPGDVLAVRGGGLAGDAIRLGAALHGNPNLDGHIIVMHHYDSGGVPWGLQGQPGGVGWVDMRPALADEWTLNNCGQPGRSDSDRTEAAKDAEGMLGTRYDWVAILGDGGHDLGISYADLHVKAWNLNGPQGIKPGEVVCSSFAAYVYAKRKWNHPDLGNERLCQPADWDEFIITNGWNVELR
jgi:hypothetical protein